MEEYTHFDLLKIQGIDHISKVQLQRSREIEMKYLEYMKTFIFSDFRKKLFKDDSIKWKFYFNDFPYNISSNLRHIVLWFNDKYTHKDNMLLAEQIIKNYFNNNVVWFINNPEFSSIKQLFHVHIFFN